MKSFWAAVARIATILSVCTSIQSSDNNHSVSVRHPGSPYWSRNCPSPAILDGEDRLDSNLDVGSRCCCSITDYGAVGDNSTINTIAIQWTIDGCHDACFHDYEVSGYDRTLVVYVPKGMFRTGSLSLRSNTRLHIARGGAIYGSDNPSDYPLVPSQGKQTAFRALLSGYNLENVSITGEDAGYPSGAFSRFSSIDADILGSNRTDASISVIDGVGWIWWCKARSFTIPQSYCREFNPTNETMLKGLMRPKLIEFCNSTNIVLDRFTARNSPNWFIHPVRSTNILVTNLTILAPREVGNTDGFDPDSSQNILMDTCYIDVGDDGVSIKSSNHSGTMVPTRNVTMRNLRIVSRNWCVGSATFGGIYDVLFEDSTIGDLETITSPWAIKFKSHRNYPGPMENITIRRIQMGHLGATPWMFPTAPGSAVLISLAYGEHPSPDSKRSGKPVFRNVTLEDISVASAGVAGHMQGFPEVCLEGLTLKNITVSEGNATWVCDKVDLDSLTISNVFPPITCGGCDSERSAHSAEQVVLETT